MSEQDSQLEAYKKQLAILDSLNVEARNIIQNWVNNPPQASGEIVHHLIQSMERFVITVLERKVALLMEQADKATWRPEVDAPNVEDHAVIDCCESED